MSTVVVVGSGPCGAAAAVELVELGVDVTMLEAGPAVPAGVIFRVRGNTVFRWVGKPMKTDGFLSLDDPKTELHRSISLGGLSNFWTAAVPRFHPRDFDEGARLDERYRWPVSYHDVEPYYDIVERRMMVTAGDPIESVPPSVVRFPRQLPPRWREIRDQVGRAGYAMGAIPMATGRPTMIARRSTGWNSWYNLLQPLLKRPNFHLVRQARVLQVEWSGTDGAARAVEYVDEATGERKRLACRAVMLAAGALDSTRILLQSRSGDFPDGLGNTHGLVGRYLHDHPKQWWPTIFDKPLPLLAHPAYIARPAHEDSDPLLACSHTIGMVGLSTRIKAWARMSSTLAGVQVFGTMVPDEEHTATLERDDDPVRQAQLPMRLKVSYDEATTRNVVAARDRFVAAMAAAGVKATPQGPFAEIHPGISVHFSGTARMHADPALGVLDAWNRVHGVPNVMVVDMAAFTTNPEKNPTLTAMALAARAAHKLSSELRSGAAF